ncbi:MAG TPA: glycosyltransferase family 4 protein, partial [Thermodesulfobacteriota bacterium]|nr:glycosyltransferase family 4 protein [Thermodesulfobacteriota bacterium]
MWILVLAPEPFYVERGTPIAVDLLVRTLADQGHRVEILTCHLGATPPYRNVPVHRTPPVPFVRSLPPGFSLRKLLCDALLLAALLVLLARRRYDVVHAVEEGVFLAWIARGLFGVPYVYDMDSSLTEQLLAARPLLRPLAPLLRAAERLAIRASLAVAPVCDALADRARRCAAARVVVLPDVSLLAEDAACSAAAVREARAEFGLPRSIRTVALYVGNLARYQGVGLLLEGFAVARRAAPDLALVVIGGDAAQVRRYRERACRLGLSQAVRFLGPRPLGRLRAYLVAADVLVSPRLGGDNTPMKIYSYLHAGRAVLATAVPAHAQVLDPAVALLVEPRGEALAEGLLRLARDPALRERLGAAGRRRAETRHSRATL